MPNFINCDILHENELFTSREKKSEDLAFLNLRFPLAAITDVQVFLPFGQGTQAPLDFSTPVFNSDLCFESSAAL